MLTSVGDDDLPTCNACPRVLTCEICEACGEHCMRGDPVACAEAVVASSLEKLGDDDERTEVARGQLRRAVERTRPL